MNFKFYISKYFLKAIIHAENGLSKIFILWWCKQIIVVKGHLYFCQKLTDSCSKVNSYLNTFWAWKLIYRKLVYIAISLTYLCKHASLFVRRVFSNCLGIGYLIINKNYDFSYLFNAHFDGFKLGRISKPLLFVSHRLRIISNLFGLRLGDFYSRINSNCRENGLCPSSACIPVKYTTRFQNYTGKFHYCRPIEFLLTKYSNEWLRA